MHSPSFRDIRPHSTKRRRSPDGSPSPLEPNAVSNSICAFMVYYEGCLSLLCHQQKRLAVDSESIPSPTASHHAFPGTTSASTSRFSSEDWVKQTDGLTIDGPLLPNVLSGVALGQANEQDRMDESMVRIHKFPPCVFARFFFVGIQTMDSDESASIYRPLLSSPRSVHRPHAPHIQITTSPSINDTPHQQYQPHNQQQSSLLSAPSLHAYPVSPQNNFSTQQNQAPVIRILPATPSDSPTAHQHQIIHNQAPSPITQSSTSPMTISPPNSPAASRKQRLTMGPRSDCEKCIQGVKGHWMHFD